MAVFAREMVVRVKERSGRRLRARGRTCGVLGRLSFVGTNIEVIWWPKSVGCLLKIAG